MQTRIHSQATKSFFSPAIVALVALPLAAFGQQAGSDLADEDEEELEEIVVTGSQIEGAAINETLAVSVLSAEDILQSGIESGDELLLLLPEHGQNFFNEAESFSGAINSARGDIGGFNLRNLGTGNTLVLLNGRRVVNAATYQTESIGGSNVPVITANSNAIPIRGVERVEVLRDGASAIYGADAVAGVVNTVLKDDFEGLTVRMRTTTWDNHDRGGLSFGVEWGQFFNDGRTNLGVFFSSYERNALNAQDDPKWANDDYRPRVVGTPWEGNSAWRNGSGNSRYGQYDLAASAPASFVDNVVDSSGELEVFPLGHENCEYDINDVVCGAVDGPGALRYNFNAHRDVSGSLDRQNLFLYLNHAFDSGLELFTEFAYYASTHKHIGQPSSPFGTVKLDVGAMNYYNPFGPVGSPNRFTDAELTALGVMPSELPNEGLVVTLDNYRFEEAPRFTTVDASTFRILQGLRGSLGDWDWEAAFLYSVAERNDVTANRVSNTLMQEALNDPTEAAYNPFVGGVGTNIARALVDAFRNSESTLTSIDARFVHDNIFELGGGPAAMLAGVEYRDESFDDDRDPRLDGTIRFTDRDGDTFPFVSDLVNSSPTPDNSGSRTVFSAFLELQLPLLDSLDMQAALRFEDFSDVDSAFVGKLALGWRVVEQLTLRGSFSQAYRVPNLVTTNASLEVRGVSPTDYVCRYAEDNRDDADSSQAQLSCANRIERRARGGEALTTEESLSTSFGLVVTPVRGLSITLDSWSIEQDGTVGLFGETNHTRVELLDRIAYGTDNCDSAPDYAATGREDVDAAEEATYLNAGICPVGQLLFVEDRYANLNTRTLAGYDLGLYYSFQPGNAGTFSLKFNLSRLTEFSQEASGLSQRLVDATASGELPYPVTGFGDDLIGRDGNQEQRWSMRFSWRRGDFGASLSALEIGEFYQNALTRPDGTRWIIPAMLTWDATFDYTLQTGGPDVRFRLGLRNLTNERAPLADRYFGFFADAHTDYGRAVYLDARLRF